MVRLGRERVNQRQGRTSGADTDYNPIFFHCTIQGVTGLFNKYSNVCNGNLLNSSITPYIIQSMKKKFVKFEVRNVRTDQRKT